MGMCLALHSVSDENINKILTSPPLIWRLISPDDAEMYLESTRSGGKGLLSRLFGKKDATPPEPLPELEFVEGEGVDDDLDKAWHGLHYCLNQTEEMAEPPMDFITTGGQAAGHVDVGYGPARLIDSKAVKEIETRLADITIEKLRANYNPVEMAKLDIYPNVWVRDGEEGFGYIAEYFESLKKFIAHCSRHNLGMAVFLC